MSKNRKPGPRVRPRFNVLTFTHGVARFPERVRLDELAEAALAFRTQPWPLPCRLDAVPNTRACKWAEGPCATFGRLS